jgi:hypothetical protein
VGVFFSPNFGMSTSVIRTLNITSLLPVQCTGNVIKEVMLAFKKQKLSAFFYTIF